METNIEVARPASARSDLPPRRTRRSKGRRHAEDASENNEDEGGESPRITKESAFKKEQRERQALAQEIAEKGEARVAEARAIIEALNNQRQIELARDRALSAADQGEQPVFCLDGEKKLGGKAIVALKTGDGVLKDVYEIFPGLKKKNVALVYGENLGTSFKKNNLGSFEYYEVTIKVPFSLKSQDLVPFIREVVWALGIAETSEFAKSIKRGKNDKNPQIVMVEGPTESSLIFRKAIEARQKFEQGWKENIVGRFGLDKMPELVERYEKLETADSLASRVAEVEAAKRLRGAAQQLSGGFGLDIFASYGGADAYENRALDDILAKQNGLIHQFDKDGNQILLGRPARDVEKIRPLTLPGFFGPYWLRRANHGDGWDIDLFKDRILPIFSRSKTQRELELLMKIRDYQKVENPDDSLTAEIWNTAKETGRLTKDVASTYGWSTAKKAFMIGFLGFRVASFLPFMAGNKLWNSTSDFMLSWENKLMGWALSPLGIKYKSPLKSAAEKDKQREAEYQKEYDKARGRQKEK